MLRTFETYFMIFFIYSFAGWVMESVRGIIKTKKFVNRGFLIGPYCPVYGVGVLLVTLLLQNYINDLPVLFFLSLLICGILEYFTSFAMEKIFKARWWDYHNRRFNINGRICLETLIPFGIIACIILKYVNPIIFEFLDSLNGTLLSVLSFTLLTLMTIDQIVSFRIILKFKNETKAVNSDNTEEIVNKVKQVAAEGLQSLKLNTSHSLKYSSIPKLLSKKKLLLLAKKRKEFFDKKIELQKYMFNQKIEHTKEEINKHIKEKFSKNSKLHARLLDAFPNFDISKWKKD